MFSSNFAPFFPKTWGSLTAQSSRGILKKLGLLLLLLHHLSKEDHHSIPCRSGRDNQVLEFKHYWDNR